MSLWSKITEFSCNKISNLCQCSGLSHCVRLNFNTFCYFNNNSLYFYNEDIKQHTKIFSFINHKKLYNSIKKDLNIMHSFSFCYDFKKRKFYVLAGCKLITVGKSRRTFKWKFNITTIPFINKLYPNNCDTYARIFLLNENSIHILHRKGYHICTINYPVITTIKNYKYRDFLFIPSLFLVHDRNKLIYFNDCGYSGNDHVVTYIHSRNNIINIKINQAYGNQKFAIEKYHKLCRTRNIQGQYYDDVCSTLDGKYIFIVNGECIFILDVVKCICKKCLIRIPILTVDLERICFITMQVDEVQDEKIIQGYSRLTSNYKHIPFYLLQIINHYYYNEYLHVIITASSIASHWKIHSDVLFQNVFR